MARCRHLMPAAWVLVTLLAGGQPARAQDPPPTVLLPGELREGIPAAGKVLELQGNQFSDFRSWAAVTFDRTDAVSQNIRLEARHPNRFSAVFGKAIARGMLFLDFCVPSRDAVTGCGTESATPEAVSATITFGYGYVGSVGALGFTAEATFATTASVLDRTDQQYVHIHELKNLSVKQGTKEIKEVPVPIPGIENPTLTRALTFTVIVKRGRTYRFQFAAAATSTKGLVQPLLGGGNFAFSDFAGDTPGPFAPDDGFVQLRNLTIHIGPEVLTFEQVLDSLQGRLAALAEQLALLRAEHQDDMTTLREELAELRLATIGIGPEACTSPAPGPDWQCVAGGWVPPGHPSAGGGPQLPAPPGQPPSAPTPCPGVPPAAGWVCVNGGWVPPDHPLARGGG